MHAQIESKKADRIGREREERRGKPNPVGEGRGKNKESPNRTGRGKPEKGGRLERKGTADQTGEGETRRGSRSVVTRGGKNMHGWYGQAVGETTKRHGWAAIGDR
ncbi:hypothetical protein RHGRI_012248 [Rhododendron griersonianum]|uniref:Uncharacterized protein n=1 Tax=Rhododendron griersonianum TaxID=479676 RepID=A0AAV6KRD9_9ERIC|nr:hypothetical protein RHGRI_012248 [Rhododendron griersonianum]